MALGSLLRAAQTAMTGGLRGARQGKEDATKKALLARRTQQEDEDRRRQREMDALEQQVMLFDLNKASATQQAARDAERREAEELARLRGSDPAFANLSREAIERIQGERLTPRSPSLVTDVRGRRVPDAPGVQVDRPDADKQDKPTTGQEQAAAFTQTVSELNPQIAALEQRGVRPNALAEGLDAVRRVPVIGEVVGPMARQSASRLRAPEQRQYRNMADRWAAAVLRLESKSAINQGEYDDAYRQYFVQPGEENDEAIIKQKQEARAQKERQMAAQRGPLGAPSPDRPQVAGGKPKPVNPFR